MDREAHNIMLYITKSIGLPGKMEYSDGSYLYWLHMHDGFHHEAIGKTEIEALKRLFDMLQETIWEECLVMEKL